MTIIVMMNRSSSLQVPSAFEVTSFLVSKLFFPAVVQSQFPSNYPQVHLCTKSVSALKVMHCTKEFCPIYGFELFLQIALT